MNKNYMAVAVLAGLMLGAGINSASADDSTTVIIKGRVSAATCDMGPQGLIGGNTLDLGSWASAKFVDATTPLGSKPFTLAFTNCATDGGLATQHWGVTVSGATMSGYDVFADNAGNTVGVQLKSGATVVKAGDFVGSTATADKAATGATIPFTAGLLSPIATASLHPNTQDVQATLSFVASYQ
ncbi:fimbrial protein [Serratia quinivorans]|uniref:fimbrial protein n=1 Tax=Serratia quinivorans TaxID=137545 RepID=UPI002E76E076|nr:fimbrial protein [Serratia quinivorans]